MIFNFADGSIIRYHMDAYKTAYTINSVKKLLKDANFKITYTEGDKKDWKFIVAAEK